MTRFLICFFLVVFVSGCDVEFGCEGGYTFSDVSGEVTILNNDPEGYFKTIFQENGGVQELRLKSESGDHFSKYLLSLGYLSRADGFYQNENVTGVVKNLEELWSEGVVDAGLTLFFVFYNGVEVCEDFDLSLLYLQSSAKHGLLKSQQILGYAYAGNDFPGLVDNNYSLSKYWFEQAADNGDIISAVILSGIYFDGVGVDKNDDLAFEWALRAESMQYGEQFKAFRSLAKYYEEGVGTDIDLVQAYKYYDLLSPGSAPDKARLEEQMTPEQIREAIRLSRQWQEEHNIFVSSYYGLEYQEDGTFQ